MLQFSSLVGRVMEAANHSKNSAMEAENHVKHGASSKSHTSRRNFIGTLCCLLLALCVGFPACGDDDGDKEKSDASKLIGKWEALHPTNEDGEIIGFEFTENSFQIFSNEGWESDKFGFVIEGNRFIYSFSTTELPQTWQVTGDNLTLTYPDAEKEEYKKVSKFSWE